MQNIHFSQQALKLLPPDAAILRSDVFLDLAFAHGANHDFEKARAAFDKAISLSRSTGNLRTAMLALYYLAEMHLTQGQFQPAAQLYQQGLQWCQQTKPPSASACWAHAGLGALLYEWNDLTKAISHLRRAIELAQQSGEVKVLMYPRIALAHALQTQGRSDEALAILRTAAEITQQTNMVEIANQIDVARVKVWLRQGQVDTTALWLRQHGLSLQSDDLSPDDVTMLAWFHLAQRQGHPPSSAENLARMIDRVSAQYETALAQGCALPLVRHLILLALAHQGLGHQDQAVDKLTKAVSLAEPMGLVRTFVDHGSAVAALLHKAVAEKRDSGYAAKLLPAFEDVEPPVRTVEAPSTSVTTQPLLEPLRPREIEVLRHVAQGHSNREIAAEMVMAVSTIKWYLRNIYGKLQVHRRTQALARARELNLL